MIGGDGEPVGGDVGVLVGWPVGGEVGVRVGSALGVFDRAEWATNINVEGWHRVV